MLKRYVIEREIAGVGKLDRSELGGAARKSNEALARLTGIQWQHSYVTADRTYCIYLAESEELIHEHARRSGFPATKISEVSSIIDPVTQQSAKLQLA